MRLRILIFFLLCLFCSYSFLNAESIDITQDLEKKITRQHNVPGSHPGNNPSIAGGQADAMKDIYDIKSIEEFGYDKRIIWAIIGVLGLIIITGLIFYLVDSYLKKRNKVNTSAITDIPADIEALDLLDVLEKEHSIDVREFYFRLTSIVKSYTGRRFEIDAPEMTTEELLPQINDLKIDRALKQDLKGLFTASEPVKFAGSIVIKEQMETDLLFARNFVKKTPVEIQDIEGNED